MAFEMKYLGSVIYDRFLDLNSDAWITKILSVFQQKRVQKRASKNRIQSTLNR